MGDPPWSPPHSIERSKSKKMLNLNKSYVSIASFQVQGQAFYGLPKAVSEKIDDEGKHFADIFGKKMEYIAKELDLLYDCSRSGKQSGYGHGRETFTLANRDGSPIVAMTWINHCDGPGYSCSYSHGPWFEYGSYNGDAEPDEDLVKALDLKKKLKEKFRF